MILQADFLTKGNRICADVTDATDVTDVKEVPDNTTNADAGTKCVADL